MKKHLILLLSIVFLCLLATACANPNIKTKETQQPILLTNGYHAPDGFRDLKWGDSLFEIANLEFIDDYKKADGLDVKFYRRTTDELRIGNAPLKEIEYCFIENKLAWVTIDYHSDYALEISKVIIEKYGYPDERDEHIDKHIDNMPEKLYLSLWHESHLNNIQLKMMVNFTKSDISFFTAQTGSLTFFRTKGLKNEDKINSIDGL